MKPKKEKRNFPRLHWLLRHHRVFCFALHLLIIRFAPFRDRHQVKMQRFRSTLGLADCDYFDEEVQRHPIA
jgi:hypothetical protein